MVQDMKLQHPRYADAIEGRVKEKLASLGSAIDGFAGIIDACAQHGGINGTVRALLQATGANSTNTHTLDGDTTSSHLTAGLERRPATEGGGYGVPGAATTGDSKSRSPGLQSGAIASSSTPARTADGDASAKGKRHKQSRGAVWRLIQQRMTYAQRRKLRKMSKWLDDAWLRRHVVYDTLPDRLVLGNGMSLPARSRRPLMPDALLEELQAAFERIEKEVADSPLNTPEPAGGWAVNAGIDRLGRGRFTTLPGVPGSWVPS